MECFKNNFEKNIQLYTKLGLKIMDNLFSLEDTSVIECIRLYDSDKADGISGAHGFIMSQCSKRLKY